MILIIEDEKMLAEIIDLYAENIEHKTLNSVKEFKQVPEDTIKLCTSIIIDMNLEKIDRGTHVLEYAKNLNPNIKVILMTGMSEDEESYKKFDDVLYKPFSISQFKEICNKYL